MTSVKQMVYVQPGLIPQVTGSLTHATFWASSVFVYHYSYQCYSHIIRGTSYEKRPWPQSNRWSMSNQGSYPKSLGHSLMQHSGRLLFLCTTTLTNVIPTSLGAPHMRKTSRPSKIMSACCPRMVPGFATIGQTMEDFHIPLLRR